MIVLLLSGCTSTMVEDDGESTLKVYSEDGTTYSERSLVGNRDDNRDDNLMEAPEFPKSATASKFYTLNFILYFYSFL